MKKRETIDDICLGDKFIHNGMTYDVVSFHGISGFCECFEGEQFDSYFYLKNILSRINEYFENNYKVTTKEID